MWSKARPEALLQLGESSDDVLDPTLSRIMNRTTGEWREPSPENHPCIE
jgi:hypothetical protein